MYLKCNYVHKRSFTSRKNITSRQKKMDNFMENVNIQKINLLFSVFLNKYLKVINVKNIFVCRYVIILPKLAELGRNIYPEEHIPAPKRNQRPPIGNRPVGWPQ